VTSRPTGIRRAKYEGTFAIFDLKALDDAQMRKVIQMQCKSHFFDHLLAFTEIRKGHDEIYDGWDPTICEKIEALELPNRFVTSGGHRNGDMRQRARGGDRFVAPLPAQAQALSEYLRGLNAIVTDDVLDRLDARLRGLDKDASLEEAFTDCFDPSALTAEDAARGRKHAGKLALFARKRQRKGREVTMRELHHEVCLTITL